MSYLHSRSPPIAHRDLKSGNLLVDEDWHIKVSDFGLAQAKLTTHAHTQVGTFAWMAPEVLENQPYDERADVYSFAIVMWELAVKEEPFRGMHPMQIMRVIDKGDRPAVAEGIDAHPEYVKLMQHCWEQKCAPCVPKLSARFVLRLAPRAPLKPSQWEEVWKCGWWLFLDFVSAAGSSRPSASGAHAHPEDEWMMIQPPDSLHLLRPFCFVLSPLQAVKPAELHPSASAAGQPRGHDQPKAVAGRTLPLSPGDDRW